MKLLVELQTDLEVYTPQELGYGIFLMLDKNRNASNIPKSYDIFEAYLIYKKNFNQNNKKYIQKLYQQYCNTCKNMNFEENWYNKCFFKNYICKCHETMASINYYIDRGYLIDDAKEMQLKFNKHEYISVPNTFDEFIKTLDPNKRAKISKSRKSKQLRYTAKIDNDKILQNKIDIAKTNCHIRLKKYNGLYPILFDDNGYVLKMPVKYDFFKNKIINNFYEINKNNDIFLKNLYDKYLQNFENYAFFNISYYMAYTNFFGFPSTSPFKVEIQYWLNMGYNEEESKKIISKLQSEKVLTLENAIIKYGKEEGTIRYNNYLNLIKNTRKKHKEIDTTGYYGVMFSKTIDPSTGEFYAGESLKQKIVQSCKKYFDCGRKVHIQNLKNRKSFTVYQKEYWINKGYSYIDALKEVSLRMCHTNIEWFIEHYGIKKGTEKYIARIEKYKNTMQNKSDEEKYEMILKRTKISHKVSIASTTFFKNIIKKLKEQYNIDLYNDSKLYFDNNEYYIYDNEYKQIYFYDFCIKKYKIIIEYNGCMFHPYNLSENELKNWKSLFYGISGEEQYKKDIRKQELAEQNNFHYLVIWDNENIKINYEKTIQFIVNIINK